MGKGGKIALVLAVALAVAGAAFLYSLEVRLDRIAAPRSRAPRMYSHRKPDGTVIHVPAYPGETVASWAIRAQGIVSGEIEPLSGVKSDDWVDADGNKHELVLAQAPGETYQEFCDRFDRTLAAFQRAFPCVN